MFLSICVWVSLTPLKVYLFQWTVAFDHLHKGEERDPFHIPSCSEFSIFVSSCFMYATYMFDNLNVWQLKV